MIGVYFDLDAQPISFEEWALLVHHKHDARRFSLGGESTPEEDPTRIGSFHVGEAWISTVWVGIDMHLGPGPPLIFETMIFGGPRDQEQWRYATRAEALAGHRAVVAAELAYQEP
jgi:hypothetical protein